MHPVFVGLIPFDRLWVFIKDHMLIMSSASAEECLLHSSIVKDMTINLVTAAFPEMVVLLCETHYPIRRYSAPLLSTYCRSTNHLLLPYVSQIIISFFFVLEFVISSFS